MRQRAPKHSRLSLARRLRLQQLTIFEKVVEAGSILGACAALAMTQPALSRSIHELEALLGGLLFIRGNRIQSAANRPRRAESLNAGVAD